MSWPMTSMRPEISGEQAGEQLEQRGLAGAVGAEQRDEFSGLRHEAYAIDGANRTVVLDDVVRSRRERIGSFDMVLPGLFNRAYASVHSEFASMYCHSFANFGIRTLQLIDLCGFGSEVRILDLPRK